MAEDTDKKPDSASSGTGAGNKAEPVVAKVGDGGKAPRRLKLPSTKSPLQFIRHNKRYVLYTVLVAAILIGGWLFIKQTFHIGDKVYAQVGSHKIYKQDVEDLIGKHKDVSDHNASIVLANRYLYEYMANKQGIKVTDAEIKAAYGSNKTDLKKQKSDDPYLYQLTVNGIYSNKLEAKYNGVYKGFVLVGQFNRYIPVSSVSAGYKKAFPKIGDPKAIAADKQYAKDFLDKLYSQLKDHKITWEQAAKMEQNDPRIGLASYPSLSHSSPFDTSKRPVTLFDAPTAQQKISGLKKGDFTKPFVVQAYSLANKKAFDSYYLIVRMDYRYGGSAKGDFFTHTLDTKKQLHYQINV